MAKHRPIEVLLVLRWLGGIRTFCLYVYKNFDPERFRFTLLVPDVAEMRGFFEELRDLKLNIIYSPISCDLKKQDLQWGQVTKNIFWGSYDLVHSHGFSAGLACSTGAFIKSVPHLLTLHDVFNQEQFNGVKGMVTRRVVSLVTRLVDRIHCVGSSAGENACKFFPSIERKMIVITNGIEVERFIHAVPMDVRKELSLCEEHFLIGFFGRFMSQKGFRYLVDALEILRGTPSLPKIPVVVAVNDGGFIREEKERIFQKGLDAYVRFLPFQRDVGAVIRGVDVVAMPSLWEACSLLPMETLVAGVPLICTDIPTLKETAEGTPTRRIPPRDSVALSDAIFAEMTSPSKAKASSYREIAATRFDVRRQATAIQSLYLEMVGVSEKR